MKNYLVYISGSYRVVEKSSQDAAASFEQIIPRGMLDDWRIVEVRDGDTFEVVDHHVKE